MISCFNIQEAGGEEERGIDQSGAVKVSEGGRGHMEGGVRGVDERGRGRDGGEGEMKAGRGWREGVE